MTPKKVLIVAGKTHPHSGSGRYAHAIIRELDELQLDYLVLADAKNSPSVFRQKNVFQEPVSFLHLITNSLRVRRELRRYDNVHALECWPVGVYAWLGAWGSGKKFFINAVGTYSIPSGNIVKRFLMKCAYRQAEKIFCISRYTKDRLCEYLPCRTAEVVSLGTTVLPNLSPAQEEESAKKYNFGMAEPLLLTVGALKERKGQLETLKALTLLKKNYPNVLYLMVGVVDDAQYVEAIRRYTHLHGLEDNIKIIPEVRTDAELAYLYAHSTVFLLPALSRGVHFEGFGLVLLEAAHFSKPLLGSRQSGIEDIIQDGYNGYLVKQNDPDDIYQKLLIILGSEYERLAENSRLTAQKFTWRKTVASYIRYYA